MSKRAISREKEAIERQERRLADARVKRRAAIWDLMEKIADLPIEKAVEQVGREMARRKPNGKS